MCKVYDIINGRITDLLEQGTVPWKKTWHTTSNYPKNLISKKEYRGINVFMLACQEYSSQYWMTFNQVKTKGGHVIKGSKSTPVIFWKWLDGMGTDAEETKGKIPMLRFYNVFNLEQTEGITAPATVETINTFTPIEKAEQIISGMPLRPNIRHGGNRASYSPMLDYIKLPDPTAFDSTEEYYSTLYHELSHSTGHASRVGRKGVQEANYFGSHEYCKEELIAEMGAAFLSGHSGIEQRTLDNSAAYIQGWLRELKNDKTLLIQAAAQGQKAADYILNKEYGSEEDSEIIEG